MSALTCAEVRELAPELALGILSVLMSLYGLYLLYLGAPATMGVLRERAVGYTLAVVVATIIVVVVISAIVGALIGAGMIRMM